MSPPTRRLAVGGDLRLDHLVACRRPRRCWESWPAPNTSAAVSGVRVDRLRRRRRLAWSPVGLLTWRGRGGRAAADRGCEVVLRTEAAGGQQRRARTSDGDQRRAWTRRGGARRRWSDRPRRTTRLTAGASCGRSRRPAAVAPDSRAAGRSRDRVRRRCSVRRRPERAGLLRLRLVGLRLVRLLRYLPVRVRRRLAAAAVRSAGLDVGRRGRLRPYAVRVGATDRRPWPVRRRGRDRAGPVLAVARGLRRVRTGAVVAGTARSSGTSDRAGTAPPEVGTGREPYCAGTARLCGSPTVVGLPECAVVTRVRAGLRVPGSPDSHWRAGRAGPPGRSYAAAYRRSPRGSAAAWYGLVRFVRPVRRPPAGRFVAVPVRHSAHGNGMQPASDTSARMIGVSEPVTGDHYFSAESERRRHARTKSPSCWPDGSTAWRRRPACSPPTGSTRVPPCCCARRRCPARAAVSTSTSAAGTGRSPACWPTRSERATVYAVDVNARALDLVRRNAGRRRCRATGSSRRPPDEVPDGRDASTRSGATRRSGSARTELHDLLATLAAAAGAGRLRRGWWSRSTSAATRCRRGWSATGWAVERLAVAEGLPGVPGERVDDADEPRTKSARHDRRPEPAESPAYGLRGRCRRGAHAAGRPRAVRRRVVPGRRGREGGAGRAERRRQDDAAADGRG